MEVEKGFWKKTERKNLSHQKTVLLIFSHTFLFQLCGLKYSQNFESSLVYSGVMAKLALNCNGTESQTSTMSISFLPLSA